MTYGTRVMMRQRVREREERTEGMGKEMQRGFDVGRWVAR